MIAEASWATCRPQLTTLCKTPKLKVNLPSTCIKKFARPCSNISGGAGYSLLEVLIALTILSTILLSAVAIEALALKRSYQTYLFRVATNQIVGWLERVQLNLATQPSEFNYWQRINLELLPQGNGKFDISTNSLKLCWFNHVRSNPSCISVDQVK